MFLGFFFTLESELFEVRFRFCWRWHRNTILPDGRFLSWDPEIRWFGNHCREASEQFDNMDHLSLSILVRLLFYWTYSGHVCLGYVPSARIFVKIPLKPRAFFPPSIGILVEGSIPSSSEFCFIQEGCLLPCHWSWRDDALNQVAEERQKTFMAKKNFREEINKVNKKTNDKVLDMKNRMQFWQIFSFLCTE